MNCMNIDGIKTEINKEIELNKKPSGGMEEGNISNKERWKPFANMAKKEVLCKHFENHIRKGENLK